MTYTIRNTFISACLAALSLTGTVAQAEYPERPITLVVPYAPGGTADAIARVLANGMGTKLNTTVIVENRPGASGTIGARMAAKADADGYTVLYDATPYSINPHLFLKLPYAADALQPVSLVLLAPNIVIVKPDSPYKTIEELIAAVKAEPGTLNFASGGSGTVQRLAGELFRQKLGLDMVHVAYRSGGPAIVDVMGGQVDSCSARSPPLIHWYRPANCAHWLPRRRSARPACLTYRRSPNRRFPATRLMSGTACSSPKARPRRWSPS